CLAHDVQDIFRMMADCILEPRSSVTANAAISKMKHLPKIAPYKYPGLKETDQIFGEIYDHKGLGMPMLGDEKNIENLNAFTLQKFQIENFSPERIFIAGLGVENHGEFVNLAEEYFSKIRYGGQLHTPEKQAFKEIELRVADSASNKNEIFLVFESAATNSKDFIQAALAREYFGQADVSNPNCHSKNNGVFVSDFYNKEKSIHAAEAYNFNFNDTGLFGFRLNTTGDQSNKAIDALAKHLHTLDKITDVDFWQAQKRLKRRISEGTENDFQRINELLCHQSVYGDFKLESMLKEIDGLHSKDLAAFLRKTVSGKAAVLVKGPNVSGVHGLSKIKELMK
ncbi:insulinase family protein, partial [Dokdonella sp.]|uniref:insulinase family protein n=1 Tax=Dokdonella sp. TaxID=2291710 RepID=UPI002DD64188